MREVLDTEIKVNKNFLSAAFIVRTPSPLLRHYHS